MGKIKMYGSDGVRLDFDPVDDADVIKKDGSVAFTGDQAMGTHKLTGVKAPTAEGDALSKGDAVLVGTELAVVANANVIGGIPVIHRILIADGAADTDVVLTHKTRVIDVWAVKTAAAGAAGDNITIKNVGNAITDAIDIGTPAADKVLVRAGTIDDANHEVAAGAILRVTAAHNTNNACIVYVLGIRVA